MVFKLINDTSKLVSKFRENSIELENSSDSLDPVGRTVWQHLTHVFIFGDIQTANDNVAKKEFNLSVRVCNPAPQPLRLFNGGMMLN